MELKNDMKITITVDVNSNMKNKLLNAIKCYIEDKIQDGRGCFSDEFQEFVLTEEGGFDDETTFEDVGIKISTLIEHDWL